MGNKATREIEPQLGTFDSPSLAWERRLMSGQVGPQMTAALNKFGHDRGLAMFADWSNRIAAGEVPQAPPRPQGIERNVVITLWEVDTDKAFIHDVISTNDEWNPTANAYGPGIRPGLRVGADLGLESERQHKIHGPGSATEGERPAAHEDVYAANRGGAVPLLGQRHCLERSELYRHAAYGQQGTHLVSCADRGRTCPLIAGRVPGIPMRNSFPMPDGWVPRGIDNYDPKTGKIELIDLCYSAGHMAFGNDKDETLYYTSTQAVAPRMGGVGWVKTRVWDQTHDVQKSMGWCAAVLDYNGDGKTGAYTKPDEPIDPKLDRAVDGGNGYGFAFNPVDGSVWYAGLSYPVPGRIVRMVIGDNPPATCKTEVYEPPFDNPEKAGRRGFWHSGNRHRYQWHRVGGAGRQQRSRQLRPAQVQGAAQRTERDGAAMSRKGGRCTTCPDRSSREHRLLADHFYHNWVDRYDSLAWARTCRSSTARDRIR